MTRSPILAVVFLLPALVATTGCASRTRVRTQQGEIDQLKAQLSAVQRDQSALRDQNESLRNQMFVLHDRVESARTMLARTQQAPPKLEVVKLSPTPAKDPLAARVRKAATAPAVVSDDGGYDPSADEAEMFSVTGDAPIRVEDSAAGAASMGARVASAARPSDLQALPAPIETLPAALENTTTARPAEDPMTLYQRAFGLFQARKWSDANLAFQQFVDAHPAHEYADNAYYWMGECYYAQGEYVLAIGEFQKVPEMYPGGNKVPDALLKIGLSYVSVENRTNAEKTFRQLVDAYPQSDAAAIGRQKLQQVSKAGGNSTAR